MSKRFKRQDYFRYKRLGKKWRRPRGRQSKMRRGKRGAGDMPAIGYRTPASARYKVRGLSVRLIRSLADMEKARSEDAVLIAGSVGTKKRALLAEAAKAKGIAIINASAAKRALRAVARKKEQKEIAKRMEELKKKEEARKEAEQKAAKQAKEDAKKAGAAEITEGKSKEEKKEGAKKEETKQPEHGAEKGGKK